jgi:alanine racemase
VATLFGPGDDGMPTATDWAEAIGTINYEIVTRFGGSRVPRVYDGTAGVPAETKPGWSDAAGVAAEAVSGRSDAAGHAAEAVSGGRGAAGLPAGAVVRGESE